MPGKTLRFVAKKMKGREAIRGAKGRAVEDAAIALSKDPRTIGGYLKAGKPLEDPKFLASVLIEFIKDPWARDVEGKKAVDKAIAEALEMLSFIQQHLTDAERAEIEHLEMVDVYKFARVKAGKPLTGASAKKRQKSMTKKARSKQ